MFTQFFYRFIGPAALFWLVMFSSLTGGNALAAETADNPRETPSQANELTLQTLDGHFPFHVPDSVDAWEARRDQLRKRVAVAVGLHPMPERLPIQATIHSPIKRDGFQFEKVYFESLPGHFVSGLLFRPLDDKTGTDVRRPAVLNPHGHGGRMMRYNDKKMASLIELGEERFPESGRRAKLARCAQLARMGCVAFIFDMVGYEDSVQIPFELAHRRHQTRLSEQIPGFREPWRFFSTPADARLQSIMGLQTFNALRAMDFLASLSDVDPQKLAITGGSGGGTQSILMAALDNRIKVSFPNGMVSTSMQGGCACENTCLLRIGTGNVELAALFAPRPMAMTAADDWTVEMMTDGFPELQKLYAMLGAPKNVDCTPLLEFPHNYNVVTRELMYQWMNRHLDLGYAEPIREADFAEITDDEGRVFDELHPAPAEQGLEHERTVLKWWDDQSNRQLALAIGSGATKESFENLLRPALRVLFDVGVPEPSEVAWHSTQAQAVTSQWGELTVEEGTIRSIESGRRVPAQWWLPAGGSKSSKNEGTLGAEEGSALQSSADLDQAIVSKEVILWVVNSGVSPGELAKIPPVIQSALGQKRRVLIVENAVELMPTQPSSQSAAPSFLGSRRIQPMNPQPRRASASFTFGYNRPLAVRRCSDVLSSIALVQQMIFDTTNSTDEAPQLVLVGGSGTAAYSLPAAAIAGPLIDQAMIATDQFRFGDLRYQDDADFVPGMVKYGDLDAWAAARAPYELTILGDAPDQWPTAAQIYSLHDADEQLNYSSFHRKP